MYPFRTRAGWSVLDLDDRNPAFAGNLHKPSDGLEPSTPSLPWRSTGGTGGPRPGARDHVLPANRLLGLCHWCPRVPARAQSDVPVSYPRAVVFLSNRQESPGCSLYSANDKGRAALRWAVHDQDCTIVNQSFHRPSEPESDSFSSDDLYGDWLALHWPYPLIVHAAGNFWEGDPDDIDPPSSEYVNHKGFKTISVGNHDDSAAAMATSSVYRNPDSPHGDRELPEICANGTESWPTTCASRVRARPRPPWPASRRLFRAQHRCSRTGRRDAGQS